MGQRGRVARMAIDVDAHVGSRLRLRRRELKLTQKQLGNAVAASFQSIARYESGHNGLDATRLWRLSSALQVGVEYFFKDLAHLGSERPRDQAATDNP